MDEVLIRQLYQELRPMAVFYAHRASSLVDAEDLQQIAVMGILAEVKAGSCRAEMSHMKHLARYLMLRYLDRRQPMFSLDAYLYDESTGKIREIAEVPQPPSDVTLSEVQRRYVARMLTMSNPRERAILQSGFGMPLRRGGHYWTVERVCKRYGLSRWQFHRLMNTLVRKWRVQSTIS